MHIPIAFASDRISQCRSSSIFSVWARCCPRCTSPGVCISNLQPAKHKRLRHPQEHPRCFDLRPPLRSSRQSSWPWRKRSNHPRRADDPTTTSPKSPRPKRSKGRRWPAGVRRLTVASLTTRRRHSSLVGGSQVLILGRFNQAWPASLILASANKFTWSIEPGGSAACGPSWQPSAAGTICEGKQPMESSEAAHSHLARDLATILPARSAWIRCFRRPIRRAWSAPA